MIVNRKLSSSEQGMEILNHAGACGIVTISRIKGGLKEEVIRQALDLIQSRHPRLNSRIINDLNSSYFKFGSIKIPLRTVQKQFVEQWQEVVVEELNQPIKSDKYLARAVLISFPDEKLNYFVTALHHAISDGLSNIQLHSEILTYCQKIVNSEIEKNIFILPPLPNIRELMPKSMQGKIAEIKGIFFLLKFQLKRFLYRPKTLSFDKCVPAKLRRSNMIQRKLNKEITAQLIKVCRQERTTVQGALCSAMMLSAAKDIKRKSGENLTLSCCSHADLRKRLKNEVDRENLGLLATSINSLHTLKKNTCFWDLARDVTQQLQASLKSEDLLTIVLMAKKMIKYLLSHPNKAAMTVSLTNIGRANITHDYGLLQLEEISLVTSAAAFGGVFAAAVTTFQNTMILNFMFSEPSLNKERVEILVNDAIASIIDVSK